MPDRTPLSDAALDAALDDLEGWIRDGDAITCELEFADFRAAMAFLVHLSYEAEQRNHHPEIVNIYNEVALTLSTHDAGNKVTEADLDLARAINDLIV